MKRMLNEASAFREEMIAGYASAYGRYLQRVPGASGVMANGMPAPGRVSVIVGFSNITTSCSSDITS